MVILRLIQENIPVISAGLHTGIPFVGVETFLSQLGSASVDMKYSNNY